MAIEVGGPKAKVRPSINVTPLVDVVLVLLIIFMVVTPMMVKQFSVHVPKKEEPTETEEPAAPADRGPVPIVLSVRKDGTVWINKDRVEPAELPERLRRIFAARKTLADKIVFFDAEDDVPYGRAMEILDTARSGKAAHIAVLTERVNL